MRAVRDDRVTSAAAGDRHTANHLRRAATRRVTERSAPKHAGIALIGALLLILAWSGQAGAFAVTGRWTPATTIATDQGDRGGGPTTVTWQLVDESACGDGFSTTAFLESHLGPTWEQEVIDSLNRWSEVSALTLVYDPVRVDSGTTDVTISGCREAPTSAGPDALAVTNASFNNAGEFLTASVLLFEDRTTADNLEMILVHEFGHALGLDHSCAGTIMAVGGTTGAADLRSDDVMGIRHLYGDPYELPVDAFGAGPILTAPADAQVGDDDGDFWLGEVTTPGLVNILLAPMSGTCDPPTSGIAYLFMNADTGEVISNGVGSPGELVVAVSAELEVGTYALAVGSPGGPLAYRLTASGIAGATDTDGDLVADWSDNCVDDANVQQIDTDGDGLGDACDDLTLAVEANDDAVEITESTEAIDIDVLANDQFSAVAHVIDIPIPPVAGTAEIVEVADASGEMRTVIRYTPSVLPGTCWEDGFVYQMVAGNDTAFATVTITTTCGPVIDPDPNPLLIDQFGQPTFLLDDGRYTIVHLCALWCGACIDFTREQLPLILDELDATVGPDAYTLREVVLEDSVGLPSSDEHAAYWATEVFGDADQPVLHMAGDPNAAQSLVSAYLPPGVNSFGLPAVVVIAPDGEVILNTLEDQNAILQVADRIIADVGVVTATPTDDVYGLDVALGAEPLAGGSTYVSPGSVLDNDTIPTTLAAEAVVVSEPAEGTLHFASDGTFTFDAPVGFATTSFRYSVRGSNGQLGPDAHVTLHASPAHPDGFVLSSTTPSHVRAPGLLGNDPTGAAAVAGSFRTRQGEVVVGSDGSFTYTPDPTVGPADVDTFIYRAGDGTAPVTIRFGTVSIGNAQVTESDPVATLEVQLSEPMDVDVNATVATENGTAVAGVDYAAISGTVTIPAGAITGQVQVKMVDDRTVEQTETFTVRLSAANVAVTPSDVGTVVVTDDDNGPILSPVSNVVVSTVSSQVRVWYKPPVATDVEDGNVAVQCTPRPGSVFGTGTTRVKCGATDSDGNSASASFDVIVRPPLTFSIGRITVPGSTDVPVVESAPGRRLRVTVAGGYEPSSTVELYVIDAHGERFSMGEVAAQPDGSVDTTFKLAKEVAMGPATIILEGPAGAEVPDTDVLIRSWVVDVSVETGGGS